MNRVTSVVDPLRIVVFGFSERNAAVLQQLFSGARWQDCQIVASGPADLGIVDLDTPSSERSWAEYRSNHPHTPSIVLSLREQRRENAHFLKKPVNPSLLRSTIDTLSKQINGAMDLASPVSAPEKPDEPALQALTGTPTPPTTSASTRVTTQDAADELDIDWDERYSDEASDVDLSDPSVHSSVTYDPNRYFQGLLEKAIDLAATKGVAHEIGGTFLGTLRIVPGAEIMVEHSLRMSFLRPLCVIELKSTTTPILPSHAPIPGGVRVKASEFLWQIALWTARGRLRTSIPLNDPIRLLQWPNFTRVVESPYAMQISAILVRAPQSAAEICTRLKMPQRHVFDFLSAAETAGILELVPDVPASQARSRAHPRPLRSLFKRILHAVSRDAA